MATAFTKSLYMMPTGMQWPKPSTIWMIDAVNVGDGSGGLSSTNIDIMPGSYGDPDCRIATIEALQLVSSTQQKLWQLRWEHRWYAGASTHYFDYIVESSMKKPTGVNYYTMLHASGNPSNNQPVGQTMTLPFFKQMSYVASDAPYNLTLLSVNGDNVNLEQDYLNAWGYAWDRMLKGGVAPDNVSWRA